MNRIITVFNGIQFDRLGWKLGFFIALLYLCLPVSLFSQENWQRIIDLRGHWQFAIGDDSSRAKPSFDDRNWERMFVPSNWENEGYPGYDGFAWYRKTFSLPADLGARDHLYLRLGIIDDADEVYINGHFVGFSGRFPPNFETAFHIERRYYIPPDYLEFNGENVIAVRVYDDFKEGGLIRGQMGLYRKMNVPRPKISLAGQWQFKTGDEPHNPHKEWKSIQVPSVWETQGFRDYDGFAWYRTSFRINESFKSQQLVLLLGRIDDVDEAYLNGERIGSTGRITGDTDDIDLDNYYLQYRGYRIPKGLIRYSGQNILTVRVYDGFMHGGIYEGPVGIIDYASFKQWAQREEKPDPIWEWLRTILGGEK